MRSATLRGLMTALLSLGVACTPSYTAMYPGSLARVLRHETHKTVADHYRILVYVIDSFDGDTPAGLNLELGYYAWQLGKVEEAEAAIDRELDRYPEFAPMIERAALQIRTLAVLAPTASERP